MDDHSLIISTTSAKTNSCLWFFNPFLSGLPWSDPKLDTSQINIPNEWSFRSNDVAITTWGYI